MGGMRSDGRCEMGGEMGGGDERCEMAGVRLEVVMESFQHRSPDQ